jgi:hypothetical protein
MYFKDTFSKNLTLNFETIELDPTVGMTGQCPSCGSLMMADGSFLNKQTIEKMGQRWLSKARCN